MFANLFKPKIEHPDPQVRMAAVKALSGPDGLAILCEVAVKDEDESIRQQALSQLQTGSTDNLKFDSAAAANLFKISTDSAFKQKLIPLLTESAHCLELIDTLEDEELLISFSLSSTHPVIRKSATEKISGLDTLKQLQQQCSDKNVLQVVRQKIQLIKFQQKQKQQALDSLTQICEALERLAKSDFESHTTSRVHLLQNHWQEIDDQYKTDFTDRYQQALQVSLQKINVAKQQAALEEFNMAQNQLCRSICDTFEGDIKEVGINSKSSWKAKVENISGQWRDVCKDFSPDRQTSERFYNLSSAAENISTVICALEEIEIKSEQQDALDAFESLSSTEQSYFNLTKQLSWSAKVKQPQLYSDLKQHHSSLKTKLKTEQKKNREKRQEIEKKVVILKSHIRQKNLIKANRLYNYIHNLLAEFPASLKDAEEQKLDVVTQSLNELRGLNKFVTAPKKESLCEQMEALIDNQQEPEKLMQHIKLIQDKWKSLATSDAQADDILWERFKLAADKAYEPCMVYLKEVEALKHSNIELRKKLSEQVESKLANTDWEHVDWKKIQSDYNQDWKSWNALAPVFFSENKPVQQHFESLMNQIKDKLGNEKNENHQLYDQLIERAQTLVDGLHDENIDEGIEQVKRLQSSWKNIGITHFNKSNKQWKKFRKLCDQVFEFQRTKHKTLLAQADLQASSAFKIIDQIKALKNLPDEQLPASQSQYQNLKQQFEEDVDLPENRQEKIEQRFKQVCEDYESYLSALPARARLSNHHQLRKAAKLCVEAEILALDGTRDNNLDAVKAEFESIDSVPEKSLVELQKRIDQAHAVLINEIPYDSAQLSDNESLLNQLAIELEVIFDLESPESAKPQRMSYQLEQLQAGIKPSTDKQTKLDQLTATEIKWYNTGAVNSDVRRQLEARLQAVIKQAET